jgi:hypothetical protein
MATAQKITRDNFTTLLVRSTQGRSGTPDGNVFLDTANDKVQLITASELANVDLGGGAEANPLTNVDKIQSLALYFFILQEVEANPSLQNFRFSMDAVSNRMGKLVGATAFLNGISLDAANGSLSDERFKIADSGFTEFQAGGGGNTIEDRVYHGIKSLTDINNTSQPFYQIAASLSEADRQSAAPTDFSKPGDINEVVQTYLNGGTDNRTNVLIIGVRDFGYTNGEVNSSAAGVAELGAYSQGYGIGNIIVSSIAALTEADVWGGSQVAPYTGLGFFRYATTQTRTDFVEADGDFTDSITNTGGATLLQIRAWMDKLMQQGTDQNDNTGVTGSFIPQRAEPLYTIDGATGNLVTRVGLYIENLSAADKLQVVLTADDTTTRTYPFNAGIAITVSDAWLADTSPWFRLMYSDGAGGLDFDTSSAVTVEDSAAVSVAGDATDARITGNTLSIEYAYASNTQAGLVAGDPKDVILQIGGIDGSKSRTIPFTITESTSIVVDASTDAETN